MTFVWTFEGVCQAILVGGCLLIMLGCGIIIFADKLARWCSRK